MSKTTARTLLALSLNQLRRMVLNLGLRPVGTRTDLVATVMAFTPAVR
jgi:hypothetical protein